tara:strand:- start:457 stop:879 length:423 start_codon:yes stop_codon:yes gene_type:complete
MMATTATILKALKTRIEGITPSEMVTSDHGFKCFLGFPRTEMRERHYVLTANAGAPAPETVRCKEWLTSILLAGHYPRGETGLLRAITDSEQIAADLFSYANNNPDGVYEINQDQAQVIEQDDYVAVERNLRVRYRGQEY